jgi:hypothetical protein
VIPTLTDFLLARIAEDEAAALAASPSPWRYGDVTSVAGGSLYDATVMIASMHWDNERVDPHIRRTRTAQEADANGAHIERHDPYRVLAECEAKRRTIDYASGTAAADRILFAMALPYADHIAYNPEWRRDEWRRQ